MVFPMGKSDRVTHSFFSVIQRYVLVRYYVKVIKLVFNHWISKLLVINISLADSGVDLDLRCIENV